MADVRPQNALNNEKKKKLQPKFDKIKAKVDAAKEKAQDEFKKGLSQFLVHN